MSASLHDANLALRADRVTAGFGARIAVDNVSLECERGAVTAIIGPSGCGKSTLLRCFNRLHERTPGATISGSILIDGADIYARDTNVVALRRNVGMVFQRATAFPALTIRENVAAGLRAANRSLSRADEDEGVERALKRAALWNEVRDRLNGSAQSLSGGQEQRLCIARALATQPGLLLLDEPTASLDPLSTQRIEELLYDLRGTTTIVIVTHNMQQAARVSDRTAFMLNGRVVETGKTRTLFTMPDDERTEAYVTGRFG